MEKFRMEQISVVLEAMCMNGHTLRVLSIKTNRQGHEVIVHTQSDNGTYFTFVFPETLFEGNES